MNDALMEQELIQNARTYISRHQLHLAALEALDIHMVDVSPQSNVAFLD